MRIVYPNDTGYDKARQISNARFDLYPSAIYYCTCTEDVSQAIGDAQAKNLPVRIRSGGHQHEGMCSGDGVLMIDISEIAGIDFAPTDPHFVWIGAGARLKDIYATLWQKGFMFSGGGCSDVHVGGLAQGGGWGPVSRHYGLTCDNLIAVEAVTADGTCVTAEINSTGPESMLLWSLRGGGGGNFAVVTRYGFRVSNQYPSYTDFVLSWRDQDFDGKPVPDLDAFILHWIRMFPGDHDRRLTTFLRLSAVQDASGDRVVIGGRYLGDEESARAALTRLLSGQAPPYKDSYSPSMDPITIASASKEADAAHWDRVGRTLGTLQGYQPGPELSGDTFAATGALAPPPDLSDTCAGVPLRHKISSGFANVNFDLEGVRLATRIIRGTKYKSEARQYVSFHSLGGAIRDEPLGGGNAFAFRDRKFLLQYQAWWMPKSTGLDPECIKWIEDFRDAMTNGFYTSGAFINFVDRDIPVADYYGQHYLRLRDAKAYWDRKYFFRFGLSIPPAGVTE